MARPKANLNGPTHEVTFTNYVYNIILQGWVEKQYTFKKKDM